MRDDDNDTMLLAICLLVLAALMGLWYLVISW